MGYMKRHYIDLEDVLQDRRTEEDFLEIPLKERVFRVFLFILIPLFLGLIAQLFSLNVLQGDFFKARAGANMTDVRVQTAPRGVIVDRFGKPLLHNEPATKIFLSPRDFPEDPDARLSILDKVSAALHMDSAELAKKIETKDWGTSDRLLLSSNATHDELVTLSSLGLTGVDIEPSFTRVEEIPYAFSHILGYTGLVNTDDLKNDPNLTIDDEIGRAGLEAFYDEYLRGKNGEELSYRNAQGKLEEKKAASAPVPGDMLETFIDKDLQAYMYDRLQKGLTDLDRHAGAVIAVNPQNGEVLGLVSYPSFDASNIAASLSVPYNPFFNRAISGLYNAGSTIKPLDASAVLTEGIIDNKKQIFSKGYIELPNPYSPDTPSRFLDWRPNGWVDVHTALAKSSNIFFYETVGGFEGQKGLGIDKLKEWWQKFQLDQRTGIDLAGEQKGFLPDPSWKEQTKGQPWRIGDTYNVAIGQGDFLITPIELLNYITAVANGGTLYRPRIVKDIKDENGNVVRSMADPVVNADLTSLIGPVLPDVREGMREVVSESFGTAHSLSLLPFESAAKTGTAQIQNNTKTNAFFVGFAPFKNPQIALMVLVEDSKEGSLNTIPIAKDILLWYYEHRLNQQ